MYTFKFSKCKFIISKFLSNKILISCSHSDLCSVLAGRMNSRCKACATIRKNEQRNETEEIQRRQRQKPSKNLKNLVANLKRINERLEAKVRFQLQFELFLKPNYFEEYLFIWNTNCFLGLQNETDGGSFEE